MEIIFAIVIIAFLFETMDSSAGMGFGTGLAPLLFFMGYEPLQVVPILLISEAITGITAGWFHNEFRNVNFSFKRPLNDATRVMLTIAAIGCVAIFFSVMLAYFAIEFSQVVIKTYVAVLVLLMGFIGLFRLKKRDMSNVVSSKHRSTIFKLFAALAGFNKGIGGGGYGPVVTMGQIFAGIYEKSATAIVSLAEGLVSVVGVASFFLITMTETSVDLMLLPSIFTGGFLAAVISPYMVRVLPNKIWRIVIPTYAIIMGVLCLFKIFML
ncbi:MAG: sulfite exporter TauE/SafE family protein [Euryarchaeota archaeon]|nr:sulfite exporter TauE/SafE family protein [Euryarchaeota archaeon]